ncbi:hypothetical protein [Georgenia sp. SUBG003]|uniref:hypothetical protein n=1 Tax=Georgenia sp. SUBG003 TaxID=1497974 RepID=UPI0004D925AF|nr:hypothetical protein DA06_07415 [Georgenia sp. SUBG003]
MTVLVQKDHERHIPAERAEWEAMPDWRKRGGFRPYAFVTPSLREFAPTTLRAIERAAPSLSGPEGQGVYRFLRSQLRRRVWSWDEATVEANVLDGLVLAELASELVENWRVRRRLRRAFELGETGSLYEGALEPYGRATLTAVLRTAVALDAVLTTRAVRDMPRDLGYAGMDVWGDLMDGVVPMTPALVTLIHEAPPSPEELVAMSRDGRLGGLGVHPADLDDELHRRLLAGLRERLAEG